MSEAAHRAVVRDATLSLAECRYSRRLRLFEQLGCVCGAESAEDAESCHFAGIAVDTAPDVADEGVYSRLLPFLNTCITLNVCMAWLLCRDINTRERRSRDGVAMHDNWPVGTSGCWLLCLLAFQSCWFGY